MPERTHRFDLATFYARLDEARARRGLSWRAVGRETGVLSNTLTRLGQGYHVDIDTIATLAAWAGLNLSHYVRPANH